MPTADSWDRIFAGVMSQNPAPTPYKPTQQDIINQNMSLFSQAASSLTRTPDGNINYSAADAILTALVPLQPTPPLGGSTGGGGGSAGGGGTGGSGGTSGGGSIPNSSNSSPSNPVKVATPDLINVFTLQKYNDVPIDSMADLLFEDLGGQEILSVSRTDLINGQNIDYQLIANLGQISIDNSPMNIIKLQSSIKTHFDSFPIVLEDYLATTGTGRNGETTYIDPYYTDSTKTALAYNESNINGENIIINTVNMTSDKMVQVEFISYGNMINDIIYP